MGPSEYETSNALSYAAWRHYDKNAKLDALRGAVYEQARMIDALYAYFGVYRCTGGEIKKKPKESAGG